MRPQARIILASRSPRRQEILQQAGWTFETYASQTEEAESALKARCVRDPRALAIERARAKAEAVARQCGEGFVLGADTVVALGREVLDKPADAEAAQKMLARLAGRRHSVHTGFAWVEGGSGRLLAVGCETSQVMFHRLTAEQIAHYVASGEPFDKAGGYGVQTATGTLVAEVLGSYLNVMGLPLAQIEAAWRQIIGEPGGRRTG